MQSDNKTTAVEANTTAPVQSQNAGTAKLETGKYGAMIPPSKESAD